MKILIVGTGELGFRLAAELAGEGHQIFAVDRDPAHLARVRDRLDVLTVEGNGSQLSVLEDAHIHEADRIIAATDSDEVNIIACLLARELGVPRRIARLRTTQLESETAHVDLAKLGIDVIINPDDVTRSALIRMVETPGTTEAMDFVGGQVVMRAFRVEEGSPLAGRTLANLRANSPQEGFLVVAIRRHGEVLIPDGATELQVEDSFYLFTLARNLESFVQHYALRRQVTRRVVVFGDWTNGAHLCAGLERRVASVTLIEPDAERARAAAERLDRTAVVHGTAVDPDLMEEHGVGDADYFIAASHDDAVNLMAALLARRMGTAHTLMVTHHPEYVDITSGLDIDVVVNPLMLSVGAVLREVRTGRVHSVVKAGHDQAEVLELEIGNLPHVVGRPLRDLAERDLPRQALVAAAVCGGRPLIPTGETAFQAGDRVILFARRDVVPTVMKLLSEEAGSQP